MSGKQLARRWFDEVWNQRDATVISRLFAKDGIAHGLGPNGEDLIGPAGFKPFHDAFLGGFSDLQITIDDLIEAVRHAKGPRTYDAKLKAKSKSKSQ